MAILYDVGDGIKGEKISCEFRKASKPTVIRKTSGAADIPSELKESLVDKLESAKTFKELSKEAYEAGNLELSWRYLSESKNKV
ncbi:MAG: hypothetical protein KAU16_07605 [Methanophagales archaeon]|nr:hypothetical protein [Methanophagales archaeon]